MDHIVIRKVNKNDVGDLFKMMSALDSETKYMMYEPGERGSDTSLLKMSVDAAVNGENLMLVAVADDKIVGYIAAQRGVPKRVRHIAYIVVGIRREYRHRGIGKRFFAELEMWARDVHIERLELTVVCTNDNAKKLYENSGFEVEGIRKRAMLIDGKYEDEYYMAKLL